MRTGESLLICKDGFFSLEAVKLNKKVRVTVVNIGFESDVVAYGITFQRFKDVDSLWNSKSRTVFVGKEASFCVSEKTWNDIYLAAKIVMNELVLSSREMEEQSEKELAIGGIPKDDGNISCLESEGKSVLNRDWCTKIPRNEECGNDAFGIPLSEKNISPLKLIKVTDLKLEISGKMYFPSRWIPTGIRLVNSDETTYDSENKVLYFSEKPGIICTNSPSETALIEQAVEAYNEWFSENLSPFSKEETGRKKIVKFAPTHHEPSGLEEISHKEQKTMNKNLKESESTNTDANLYPKFLSEIEDKQLGKDNIENFVSKLEEEFKRASEERHFLILAMLKETSDEYLKKAIQIQRLLAKEEAELDLSHKIISIFKEDKKSESPKFSELEIEELSKIWDK